MKKQLSKKTICQSTFSLAVLLLFIYLGFGSTSLFGLLGVPINTTTDFNKQTKEYNQHIVGLKGEKGDTLWHQNITTKKDYYGNWQGTTEILNANISQKVEFGIVVQHTRKSTETVHFEHGKRHGSSITKFVSFNKYSDDNEQYDIVQSSDTTCYDYGHVIPCDDLKNASITEENPTGFQILNDNYPWFLGTLNVLGFTNEYVQAYMDTLEFFILSEGFDFTKFDSHYDDAIELLEETPYDSLIIINSMVTSPYGMELMKDLEFRMAVIDHHREKNKTTLQFLQNNYPHFLTSFNTDDVVVGNSEWEAFCSMFDSLMNTFSLLDIYDPFFIDSTDTRIFSALLAIYQEEEAETKSILKQAVTYKQDRCLSSILKEYDTPLLKQQVTGITPKALAGGILVRMMRKYLYEGDIPRLAIKEAYTNQKSIAVLASVTTQLNGELADNEFEIQGNVVKDGGAEITERGLVWAKYNNPTVDDNRILIGEGVGSFTTSLQINNDSICYVRAFATNSAGTAYGNTISFNSSSLVGLGNVDAVNTGFMVYPNPASGKVNIDFDINKSGNISVELIDLTGRIVVQKQIQEAHIGKNHINLNISDLHNGVYIIKLNQSGAFPDSKKLKIIH